MIRPASNIQTERDILNIIKHDAAAMKALVTASGLQLPDWWIGAGFVRNRVWDLLHGKKAGPQNDIDLVYYDPHNIFKEEDIQEKLNRNNTALPVWEVVNQAFAHRLHGKDQPYASTADALADWVETATCIAVRINNRGNLELLAPHGIHDLIHCKLRPTASYSLVHPDFVRRYTTKQWLIRWPKLEIVPPNPT